jgi:hypothetical protein
MILRKKNAEVSEPGTPQLGPVNNLTQSEKNQEVGLEESDDELEDDGFEKVNDSDENLHFFKNQKSQIMFPLTLIENMRISNTDSYCFVQIKLRYGNCFSLEANSSKGLKNLQNFQTQIYKIYNRVKDVQKNLTSFWLNEYVNLFNIEDYKDPSDTVILKISNYIKGMTVLLEKLKYTKYFEFKENIKKISGKNNTYESKVCSSYPSYVFVP